MQQQNANTVSFNYKPNVINQMPSFELVPLSANDRCRTMFKCRIVSQL